MASLSTATDGEFTEFKGRLSRAGLTAEMVREINTHDDMARLMIEAIKAHPAFTLVHGLFTKVEDQVKRVHELNGERGWGFTDADFTVAEKSIPKWPEDKLVAVVLVPYLADKKDDEGKIVMTGLECTFHELWAVAAQEQHANGRWEGYDQAGPDKLRLLKGIEHKPGLRWEVIDLGGQRGKKPMDVRSPKSPHAGILAAAALHHEWIRAMDGDAVPYAWLPGYEVNVSSEGPWQRVPDLRFSRDDRKVRLSYCWYDSADSRWAVPSSRG